MFTKLALLSLIAVASCQTCIPTTDYRRHGEPCSCSTKCVGGTFCQHDIYGGTTCQCGVCDYFETSIGICLKTPGYDEPCTTTCSGGLVCGDSNGDGCYTCGCPPNHQYVNGACIANCPPFTVLVDGICQPNCPQYTELVNGICQPENCLTYSNTSCQGRADGDYPLCRPLCEEGQYVTCSNGYHLVRDCPLGFYQKLNEPQITVKLVFLTNSCEGTSSICPRDLDPFFIG